MKFSQRQDNKGQAMLLTVVLLSGAILGATTIAGLLMVYQVRNLTDVSHSARALFAADAGIEWTLYLNFFGGCFDSDPGNDKPVCGNCFDGDPANDEPFCSDPRPAFSNGAKVSFKLIKKEEPPGSGIMVVKGATAVGSYERAARAFEIDFEGATIPLFPI